MAEMSPAEVTTILRQFNGWRRDFEDKFEQPDPREIGEAIDAAIEMIERLEAAEKSDAESLAMYRKARDERDALRAAVRHEADCVEACKSEIERLRAENAGLVDDMNLLRDNNAALRAKIAGMEKQGPARLVTATAYRWRYRGAVKWQYGELTEETARVAKEHNHEVQPLYALPGAQAQPAPSVPDGVAEALQRLIENGAVLGPSSSEDALLVARYRQHLLSSAPSISPAALRPVIQWLRNGCDPMKAAKELEILIEAAPEAKP